MGHQGSLGNYPAEKNQISLSYPRRVRKHPPGDSTRITRGLKGYTRRVRSRAPSGKSEHLLASRSIPRAIPPESPGGSGATPIGCARAHPLAHQNTFWRAEASPGRFHPNHPGAWGLYPSSALTRTLWKIRTPSSEPKHPRGDSTRITRGLGGYCRGPNTGVPYEGELIKHH